MTFLADWAWLLMPLGLFGSVIAWMTFGLIGEFEDAQSRNDWMWAGVMTGTVVAFLWVGLR